MGDLPEFEREQKLVNLILQGDEGGLAELFAMYRDRLWRIINFRLDRRLRGRVDADDVLQEAYLNAAQRMNRFVHDASRSCFVWLRMIVSQTLIDVQRRHLGAQKRDARKDVSIHGGWESADTSACLAFHLMGTLTTPSSAAMRVELGEQIDAALGSMSDLDREILAVRHFEELTNREAALVLDVTEQAASIRYVRALGRLKDVMRAFLGPTGD